MQRGRTTSDRVINSIEVTGDLLRCSSIAALVPSDYPRDSFQGEWRAIYWFQIEIQEKGKGDVSNNCLSFSCPGYRENIRNNKSIQGVETAIPFKWMNNIRHHILNMKMFLNCNFVLAIAD